MTQTLPETVEAPAQPRVPKMSPSSAGMFKTCPQAWRFKYIDRLGRGATEATARGTIGHGGLEDIFDLPAGERTVEAAQALLPGRLDRELQDDPKVVELLSVGEKANAKRLKKGDLFEGVDDLPGRWTVVSVAKRVKGDVTSKLTIQQGDDESTRTVVTLPDAQPAIRIVTREGLLSAASELVAGWFELEDPNRLEPTSREQSLEYVTPDGLTLFGYVDRIDTAPDGSIRVVDYKFGKAPREGWEHSKVFQLKFYALLILRITGVAPKIVRLVFLGSKEIVEQAIEADHLPAFERQLAALWAQIERSAATGDFRPKVSSLCGYCDFRDHCPAWGNEAPPYPTDAMARLGLEVEERD